MIRWDYAQCMMRWKNTLHFPARYSALHCAVFYKNLPALQSTAFYWVLQWSTLHFTSTSLHDAVHYTILHPIKMYFTALHSLPREGAHTHLHCTLFLGKEHIRTCTAIMTTASIAVWKRVMHDEVSSKDVTTAISQRKIVYTSCSAFNSSMTTDDIHDHTTAPVHSL